MVDLKNILSTGNYIIDALYTEGQISRDKYHVFCRNTNEFVDALNQILMSDSADDIHAFMRNIKLAADWLNAETKLLSFNYLASFLSDSREDLRIYAALTLGELVAGITDDAFRYDYHYRYFSSFFTTEIGEHAAIKMRRQQSMIYYINGWETTHKNLAMFIDVILDVLINQSNHQLDVVFICQALRDIATLTKTESQKTKIVQLLNILADHNDNHHIIDTAYTRSLYGLPMVDALPNSNKASTYIFKYMTNGYSKELFNTVDTNVIFLSNLKTATPSALKKLHIKILSDALRDQPNTAFYTAMHFSNLLKVSADHKVRTLAGKALIHSFNYLSSGEQNDIVVELIKSLDIENYQFTRFIPQYLGIIIAKLSHDEIAEIIDDFILTVKTSKHANVKLVLDTAYILAIHLNCSEQTLNLDRAIRVLLTGLSHFKLSIQKHALKVITALLNRADNAKHQQIVFQKLAKKMLAYFAAHDDAGIMRFYTMPLKYAYFTVIDNAKKQGKPLALIAPDKVAFFPGSFDPFSLAHLQSATRIRDMGYEVYLAIDEFSWSKRTQPNNIRRQIVELAVTAEPDIYIYPKSEIVNIANREDLIKLRQNFMPRDVYLVMGSDVLTGASAYKKAGVKDVILSFSHLLFSRAEGASNTRDDKKIQAVIDQIKGDVVILNLSQSTQTISSTQIRTFIDRNRDIENLVDPLVKFFINERLLYRAEPQYKETMRAHSTRVDIAEGLTQSALDQLSAEFNEIAPQLNALADDKTLGANYRLLMIRRVDDEQIIGFSIFHWLKSSMIYQLFGTEDISEYIREHAGGRIIAIRLMHFKSQPDNKKIEQVLITETLAYNLAKDYHYAVFYQIASQKTLDSALKLQGFKLLPVSDRAVYAVDMHRPITLNFDIKGMLKVPIRDAAIVGAAIDSARQRIQLALTQFYPGELVLAIDRTMIYEHLLKNICDVNQVPSVEGKNRNLGANMLVTYGDLFKRWRIPNTVTKALHTERFYDGTITNYNISNHPNYLPLETQIDTIQSFNRPIILLDDLLDNGKRFKLIASELTQKNAQIKALIVAILTGRGKALMESRGFDVVSAYYLPNIRLWFNESMLYPFIGGDAVLKSPPSNVRAFYAINQIMPYVMPRYTHLAESRQVFEAFSLACLQSALDVMLSLEQAYLDQNNKSLLLHNLGDVFISPRLPYLDAERMYDPAKKPSDYIKADIALLKRISITKGE